MADDNQRSMKADDGGEEDNVDAVTRLFAQQNIHDIPPPLMQQVENEDRAEALYDVHGVLQAVEESPEFVTKKIEELRSELMSRNKRDPRNTSPNNNRLPQVFDQVIEWVASEQYLERRHWLKFLRAERFDVKKATERVLRHYQAKLEFFGASALTEQIGLTHLDDVSRQALRDGAVQLLKEKDRSGRAVIVQFARTARFYSAEVVAKLLFWSSCLAARDEEVQKKGMILVDYAVDVPEEEKDGNKRTPTLFATFPCMESRLVAVHCCTDDFSKRQTFTVAIYHLESRYLSRFYTHWGSGVECRYNLVSFGIPLDALPVRDDDSISTGQHEAWLADLELQEQQAAFPRGVSAASLLDAAAVPSGNVSGDFPYLVPGPQDVILGRGLRGRRAQGNQLLKRLLEVYYDKYNVAGRFKKAALVRQVYDEMSRNGSRFLEPKSIENDEWIEMDKEAAHSRIGHGFRNLRLAKRRLSL